MSTKSPNLAVLCPCFLHFLGIRDQGWMRNIPLCAIGNPAAWE